MLEHLRVVRQLGVDHEAEVGEVDAARRDVGRDADPCAAVAQRLERMGAVGLAQLARQRDGGEAALDEVGVQAADALARAGEDEGRAGLEEAQRVDDGDLDVVRRDADRAIVDVAVLLARVRRGDAEGVALVAAGERLDRLGQRRREQQRAALGRGRIEDLLEVLAEAEVEHLVGFVEDDDLEAAGRQRAALEVVAQPPRRADDDVRPCLQGARLAPDLHPADAGDDVATGVLVQPVELAGDLEGELARRRDDEGQRLGGARQLVRVAEQRRGHREAIGDGLARPRLRRDEQVAALRLRDEDGGLDGRRVGIAARGEGCAEGGRGGREGHRGKQAFEGRRRGALRGPPSHSACPPFPQMSAPRGPPGMRTSPPA